MAHSTHFAINLLEHRICCNQEAVQEPFNIALQHRFAAYAKFA